MSGTGSSMKIAEIADALGVSKTTVSRALSGKGRVSEETRAKVFSYAGLTSTDTTAPRTVPQGPTHNLSLVIPKHFVRLDLPFLRKCMGGICTMAAQRGYDLLLCYVSETDTVLVKEIKPDNNTRDMEKLAASIVDTLQGEHYIKAVVGIGTPINNIKDLASSFKEAQIAMEVGKVFDTEKQVISYDHLGIARLIYQLPTTLCEAFLREVFKQDSIDSLDSETLFTIQRFFENNLNVSETSRGLFVHRNTLVYRLEKIKKLTGLDLRKFDDAIVFKVALMVKKYLSSDPARY